MKRREFISLVGGAAAWPLAARGQQQPMRVIGWLANTTAEVMQDRLADFRAGLKEQGVIERSNAFIEYRWADDRNERLQQLAADLVGRRVAVLVASGGTATALAAKASTTTIPIVFTIAADPVRAGLVSSLNRPGGNITGVVGLTDQLITKRLELVTELLPNAAVIGALLNPRNPNVDRRLSDLRAAAGAVRQQIRFIYASNPDELKNAFAAAVEQKVAALIIQNDLLFATHSDQIVQLSTAHRLPTIYETYEHVVAGGLLSYGPSNSERYRLLGVYTGRVFNGEKPGDLPVMQPTKFELVINLRTARALGLTVPEKLLALADKVIE
jgi:putative ABC transport system substrate-binding protein